MSKTCYESLIYVLSLSALTGILQSIALFAVGDRIFSLAPFKSWFLAVSLVSFVQLVLLLSYYRSVRYWYSFYKCIVSAASGLCYSIVRIPDFPSVDSLVYEAIESLEAEFKIDPQRRYVTGISRGGYGAWNFICTRTDLFAAAIPICGGGDPQQAFKAAYVAVWAFHGEKDRNVPVSGSRDMINAIRKAGGNPRYTEFSNEGHDIAYKAETTPGLGTGYSPGKKMNERLLTNCRARGIVIERKPKSRYEKRTDAVRWSAYSDSHSRTVVRKGGAAWERHDTGS